MKQKSNNEKVKTESDKLQPDIKSKPADESTELAESIINTVREPLLILDKDLRVVKANRSFYDYFKVNPGETIGTLIYDLGNQQWNIPKLKELLEKILPEKTTFDNYEVEHDFSTIGKRIMLLNARQIERAFGEEKIILLAIEDITERKHLEESLSEKSRMTSEYLDILVNHAHFPIIIWDASFVITRFNNSFEKLSGYDISEVMGKKIDFLFPENKRETTLNLLENSLREEKFEIVEIDILRKDKEIRTVLWNSANVFDKDGRIIIATVAQDINERKRMEDALKESEEIFNHFMEKSPYYVFFKDKNIRALRLSANYEQMLGKPLNSILGKTMDELFPSELAKKMIEVDKEILNGRETVLVEEEFNGRYFTTIKFPIIINDIPQYLAGFTIDITEQKRAEDALRENEKFLKETQKIAQLGSYTLDLNTGIWKSSEILDTIFGIESDYDKSVEGWTSIIHPEWQQLMADYFANEVVGQGKSFDKEYKIVRKGDKTERWVHGLGELVFDKENKPIKMIGTIRDITELKNAEQEIVNLNRVYALLSNTNEAIVRIKDRQKLFDEICRIAIVNGKFRMAWIGIVNQDTNKVDIKASAGLVENYLDDINLDLNDETRSGGPTGKAIKSGTNSIANDIENDKDMLPWKDNALRLGYKSGAAFTLKVFGKIIGVFSIYSSQKDFFQQQEIRLLDEMAMDISFTLEFFETEKNRKAAEENLRISEERFRSLYENSTVGLYRTTTDGKILLANPTLVRLLGFSSFEELASRDLNKVGFVSDYDRRLFIERIDMDGEVKGFESAWTRKDGTIVYVLESAKAIRDSNGSTLYYDGVVEDITERKLMEHELRESDARLNEAMQIAMLGTWEYDVDSDQFKFNDQFYKIMRTTAEREGGYFMPAMQYAQKFVHPDDMFLVGVETNKALETTDPNYYSHLDHRIIFADGDVGYVSVHIRIEKDSHGRTVKTYGVNQNITERKQSKVALQKSEERYRSVSQSANDAVITTDSKGIIIDWNKGAEKIFGYLEAEISGKKLDTIIPKDSLAQHIKNRKRSEQSGVKSVVGKTVELQGLHKNGKEFPIELSLAEWEIPSGKFFTGIVRDITERKRAEEKIAMLAHSLKSINECVSITDMNDKVLFVNKTFLDIYGYREEEIIGKDMNVFRSQQNSPALIEEILQSTLSGGWSGELLNLRKDGSEFPIHLSTSIIYDKDNNPSGLIGVASDITEQKHMFNELLKLSKAVEQSPASIIITDIQGNIEYVNPKVIKTTGYQFSELLGKNPRIFSSGEKSAYDYKVLWDTISSGAEWRGEFHNKKKNGELYWESASISAIKNNMGEIIHYLAVKEDITELKKINEELIRSKEKAEEMNRLKSNFLANMSHELRTPLVGILGFAEIICKEDVSPEIKVMAETIYKSGNRLSDTLNLILDLSQLETEKKDIRYRKVDLVSKAKEIIALFNETANKKGLSLKSSSSQDSIIINFDERAFYSILNNLINNAIKFTTEGSISTTISLKNDSVEIKVIDTGIGIAEQNYQNIFDEFRQVSEGYTRNFEGSGLGLSITKKLVEKFGGTITVESEIGKGSTFKVILPVINTEEREKELTTKEIRIVSKSPKLKSAKPIALVVDDDPLVLTVIKRYTREYIDLDSTVDAEYAFKKLNKKQYDLIFMDINLKKGMDGKEAVKKIRTMKGYESIPIIATTAYALAGDKEDFISSGCSHYLSKPFSKTEIIDVVTEVLKL